MSDRDILSNFNEKQRRESYISKNYPDLYQSIINFINENGLSCGFTESVFLFSNDNQVGKCKICQGITKFRGFNSGYNTYCSRKCSMSDKDVIKKRNEKSISNCLIKYGVTNTSKLNSVKEKTKKTNLDRYGVDIYSKTDEYLSKVKKTNLNKYGTDWFMQTKEFFDLSKSSKIEKWGVDHHTKSEDFKIKYRDIIKEKWGEDNYTKTDEFKSDMVRYYKSDKFKFDLEETNKRRLGKIEKYYKEYNIKYDLIKIEDDILLFRCEKCEKIFKISKQLYYLRNKNSFECCTICNPTDGKNTSVAEKEIFNFLRKNYDGRIIENFKIGKVESDIYLPDLKIGFEYNGL